MPPRDPKMVVNDGAIATTVNAMTIVGVSIIMILDSRDAILVSSNAMYS